MPALLRNTPVRIALVVAVLLALFFGYRAWRGPELPGYRLAERPLLQRVVASGQVSSQSLAQVGSEITGVVTARHVREGDRVQPGDLLIELDDATQQAQLREAQAVLAQLQQVQRPQAVAALQQAQGNLQQAASERQRREELFARGLLPAEQRDQARNAEVTAKAARDQAKLQLESLKAGGAQEQLLRERLQQARAALAKTKIYAQVAGAVQTRNVEPGDLVQPGRTLLQIARADSREILVALDEKSLGPVALGQPAQVVADAYPGRVVPARVSFIAPSVDAARGTADVHLELLAPAEFLRQGMTVSVNIDTGHRDRALVIPNDALQPGGAALRVEQGRARRVPLRLGLRGTTLSEVTAGLAAGDIVLAAPVEPGSRVRVKLQPLPAGPESEGKAEGLDPSKLPLPGGG